MEDKLLLDWMKEVNGEFKLTRGQMVAQHNELRDEIAANREEFVIFKTKVNVRTAMISSSIGFVALILSIILNLGSIKERRDTKFTRPDPVEIVDDQK